jgi:hypothetical protein
MSTDKAIGQEVARHFVQQLDPDSADIVDKEFSVFFNREAQPSGDAIVSMARLYHLALCSLLSLRISFQGQQRMY